MNQRNVVYQIGFTRAWDEEEQGIAKTLHRVMLAEDVDKVRVEDKAMDVAWAAEEQGIARTVHRVILAKDVDKVEGEVRAMDVAWAEAG